MHVPIKPPDYGSLIGRVDPTRFSKIITADLGSAAGAGEYLHWDKLIHLTPPADLSQEEWWLRLKVERRAARRLIPLVDVHRAPFSLTLPDLALELLHRVDQQASGRISMADAVANPANRDRYVVSSLIEEAITSSQLEGASTTRRVAKEMLRSGRAPRDRSERMIANNYAAMQLVGNKRGTDLTPDMLFELQRLVTLGTLDNPSAAGRLQRPDEDRVKVFGREDQLLHVPPPAAELPSRLTAMCDFANGRDTGAWLHPVVRAIILHFWLGYDHYFEDGNGRTARAIFYWSMLRQDYWLTEFLTISTILRRAPVSYAQSFLLTETDDNDLTYFLIHHLDVLVRALDALKQYLDRKVREVREVEALVRGDSGLNHRQRALLGDALRNVHGRYTIESHRRSHNVVYQTARADLLDLATRGLLEQRRDGKAFVFTPPVDLSERLRSLR